MRKTKICGSLLVFVLMLLFCFSVTYAQPADTSNHWAANEINKWSGKGVVNGYPDGTFMPDASIKRSEFFKLTNTIFNYVEKSNVSFKDVPQDAWYADAISKAVAAGAVKGDGDGKVRPDDNITRQEAAVVFSRVFNLTVKDKNAANKFIDAASMAGWSKDAISSMVESGCIKGRPDNSFGPVNNITRAETVKIIDNMISELYNAAGDYSQEVNGNVVVNVKDVKLKNMTINGNLYLAEGIGDGNIYLDNVVIKGKTVVRGGGENSIVFTNTSTESLLVIKVNGKVRIVTMGEGSRIGNAVMGSGGELEGKGFGDVVIAQEIPAGAAIKLDGDFESVEIEAANVGVNVESGSIGKLEVKEGATGSNINVTGGTVSEINVKAKSDINLSGGTITKVELSKDAAGTNLEVGKAVTINTLNTNANATVTGEGKIENANVNAGEVKFDKKPETLITAPDAKTTIGNDTPSEPSTPSTGDSGNDGGGGGSSDTTAPSTPIITTTAQTINASSIVITGTAEASSTINITGGAAAASGTATDGSFSITVTLTQDAVNTLSITATDASNNVSATATVAITEDSTAPSVPAEDGTADKAGTTQQADFNIVVNAETGAVVTATKGGSNVLKTVTSVTAASGKATLPINITALAEGSNAIVITVTDAAENASSTLTVNVTKDTTAPANVTGLNVLRDVNNGIRLSWINPDAADFESVVIGVYQDSTELTSLASVVTAPDISKVITELTNGTTYTFKVKSVDTVGNISNGNTITGVPRNPAIPLLEGNVTIQTPGITDLVITWSSATDDVSIVAYAVYNNEIELGTVTNSVYTVTGLTPATTYQFSVKALDGDGNSSTPITGSLATLADNVVPEIGEPLAISNVNMDSVRLTWTEATDNVDVTGYEVFQGDTILNTVTDAVYDVTGLTPSTLYTFKVRAYDAAENRSSFITASQTTAVDSQPPVLSGNIVTSGITETQIALNWDDATDNVETVSYAVYKNGTQLTTVVGSSYTVTALTPDTGYIFQVYAEDAEGNVSSPITTVAEYVYTLEDTTAPIITLTGDAECHVNVDGSYVDQGASAVDNVDGNITVVPTGLPVVTSTIGTYIISYNATDSAGNPAETVTRSVYVDPVAISDLRVSLGNPPTADTITLLFSQPVEATVVDMVYSTNGTDWITTGLTLNSSSTSAVVSELDSNTSFHFKLNVTGGKRAGTSNSVTISTAANIVMSVSDWVYNTIDFNFTAIPAGAGEVLIQKSENAGTSWTDASEFLIEGDTEVTVTDLVYGRNYQFRLAKVVSPGIYQLYSSNLIADKVLSSVALSVYSYDGSDLILQLTPFAFTESEHFIDLGLYKDGEYVPEIDYSSFNAEGKVTINSPEPGDYYINVIMDDEYEEAGDTNILSLPPEI